MNESVKLWNDEQHHTRNAELVYQILQSNDKQVIKFAKTEFYTSNRMNEVLREKLQQTIKELPELEQSILLLQCAGKSYDEIAEELRDAFPSLKPSSVRNRLSRVKKILREWAAAWEQAYAEGHDLNFSEFMEKQKKKR